MTCIPDWTIISWNYQDMTYLNFTNLTSSKNDDEVHMVIEMNGTFSNEMWSQWRANSPSKCI